MYVLINVVLRLRVNVCPFQGSRTIRTEEAVLISLAKFSPHLAASGETKGSGTKNESRKTQDQITPVVEFSDGGVSDESSESSDSE